jgi:transposase
VKPATSVARAATQHKVARAKLKTAVRDAYPALSSREIAELAGVSHQTVYNWLRESR